MMNERLLAAAVQMKLLQDLKLWRELSRVTDASHGTLENLI